MVAKLDGTGKIKVAYSQISGNTYASAWLGLYAKGETNNKVFLPATVVVLLYELTPSPELHDLGLRAWPLR